MLINYFKIDDEEKSKEYQFFIPFLISLMNGDGCLIGVIENRDA